MEKIKEICKQQPLIIILLVIAFISSFAILNAAPLITTAETIPAWFKQIMFYLVAFILIFIIRKVGNEQIYDKVWILYWICIVLLVGLALDHIFFTKLIGKHIIPFAKFTNGATSWYNLGGVFSLQPSEFIKIVIVMVLAKITKEYNDYTLIRTFENEFKYIVKCLGVVVLPAILIYLQNDTGVVLILLMGVFFVLISSGLRGSWFTVGFIILGLLIISGIYIFFFQPNIFSKIFTGHTLDRFYGWANPEGTMRDEGLQLFYSLLSYGSAGWFGHGFQSFIKAIPEAQTDFIFAVILTNYGYVGGIITILATFTLDITILKIGFETTNQRDKYFIMGVFGMIAFQQVWNMSMILGLLPITGITLPFISSGGSSLLSYMIAMGIIMDVHAQNKLLKNRIL